MSTKDSLGKRLLNDEEGVMMVEYVIILTAMVVAFIWLNKTADAVLFGADPSARFGDPTQTEAIANVDLVFDPESQSYVPLGSTSRAREILQEIDANEGEQKAYLAQIYIHLSRP